MSICMTPAGVNYIQVIKTFSTREGWWYIGIKGEMVV